MEVWSGFITLYHSIFIFFSLQCRFKSGYAQMTNLIMVFNIYHRLYFLQLMYSHPHDIWNRIHIIQTENEMILGIALPRSDHIMPNFGVTDTITITESDTTPRSFTIPVSIFMCFSQEVLSLICIRTCIPEINTFSAERRLIKICWSRWCWWLLKQYCANAGNHCSVKTMAVFISKGGDFLLFSGITSHQPQQRGHGTSIEVSSKRLENRNSWFKRQVVLLLNCSFYDLQFSIRIREGPCI